MNKLSQRFTPHKKVSVETPPRRSTSIFTEEKEKRKQPRQRRKRFLRSDGGTGTHPAMLALRTFFIFLLALVSTLVRAVAQYIAAAMQWLATTLVITPLQRPFNWLYHYPASVQFRRTTKRYLDILRSTESYTTYRNTAASLDQHCGVAQWRFEAPPPTICNAEGLILDAHVALALARSGNKMAMCLFLRSMLLRNAHGMCDQALYEYFTEAKSCIEDYCAAVKCLIEVFIGVRRSEDAQVRIRPCLTRHKTSADVTEQIAAAVTTYIDAAQYDSKAPARVTDSATAVYPPLRHQANSATRPQTPLLSGATLNSQGRGNATSQKPLRSFSNAQATNTEKLEVASSDASPLLHEPESSSLTINYGGTSLSDRCTRRGFSEATAYVPPNSTFLHNTLQWAYTYPNEPQFPLPNQLQVLRDTLRSYGLTALILSGGSSMGAYHAGVVRGLYEAKVLPRILSGSSAGSIIAALICTKHPDELARFMKSDVLSPDALQLTPFGEDSSITEKLSRFLRTGVLMDVRSLMECIRSHCGDMTFMEAFQLTGTALNISVTRDQQRGNHAERHALLNYLTSPNVVVWSAVSASCALPGLFTAVQLVEKSPKDGSFRPYLPGEVWCDGSVAQDIPRDRLAELYNANYFIVSQVNPFVIPFMEAPPSPLVVAPKRSLLGRWWFAAMGELRHWLIVAFDLGLLPKTGPLEVPYMLLTQCYGGNVTILPIGDIFSSAPDYMNIVNNPSAEYISFVSSRAQVRTWPYIARIRYATYIERALVDAIETVKQRIDMEGRN